MVICRKKAVPVWIILGGLLLRAGLHGEGEEKKSAIDPRPRLVAQLGHSGIVNAVALSPHGGRFALTGSSDATARLWDVATGLELGSFAGHKGEVNSVVFSPNGDSVLTASADGTACLWGTDSCKQIRCFRGHKGSVRTACFSSAGQFVVTSSNDKTARIWNAAAGNEIRRLEGHTGRVYSAVFSHDDKFVLTSSEDRTARLWEAATGKFVRQFAGIAEPVSAAAFSPDGKRVLTGNADGSLVLWETATGNKKGSLDGHSGWISTVSFSADGQRLVTCSQDRTTRIWNVASGKEENRMPIRMARCATISADGRWILTGHQGIERIARLWNIKEAKEVRRLQGQGAMVQQIAVSPDGRLLAVAVGARDLEFSPDGLSIRAKVRNAVQVWDALSGQAARHFSGGPALDFSPDSTQLLVSDDANRARLWQVVTGKEIRQFQGNGNRVETAAFAPDGRWVLLNDRKSVTIWERASGKEIRRFQGLGFIYAGSFWPNSESILISQASGIGRWERVTGKGIQRFKPDKSARVAAISPNGKFVLTGGISSVELLDVGTGKSLRHFKGHNALAGDVDWKGTLALVTAVAFSRDGQWALTGSEDMTAKLWDVATGKELRTFFGHSDGVKAVAFARDGRSIWTAGGEDGTARLWEVTSGKELCRLLIFKDGTWAVIDADGRFDASYGGDVQGLHWVVGKEAITLDQLKARYYEPGLLAKYLGFDKTPLRNVAAFAAPKLFPSVQLTPPSGDTPKLQITLINRGGGIGRVLIKVNGREATADARGKARTPDAKNQVLQFDLSAPEVKLLVKPGEKNRIEVQAFNAEDYLRSPSVEVDYEAPGEKIADQQGSELWAVVAGVSDYRDPLLHLNFAARDAEDFAKTLFIVGEAFFLSKRALHIEVLGSRRDAAHRPNRANLIKALQAARQAKPKDVFVIYLAGHAVTRGGDQSEYYFYTCDARNEDVRDPDVLRQTAISGKELADLIKQIPAEKQVMILDTCFAGRALDRLVAGRDPTASQARALERLKDATGLHILASCAGDAKSFESQVYNQGLLTYSLLLGMHGPALREEEFVDVSQLFFFACNKVPELAKTLNRNQFPRITSPRGGSFDFGKVTPEGKARIPLKSPRPMVQFMALMEENQLADTLDLGKHIRDHLRETSTLGLDAPFVFVDSREEIMAAYQFSGLYKIVKDQVLITARLARKNEKEFRFKLTGPRSKTDELAVRIVEAVEKRVAALENAEK